MNRVFTDYPHCQVNVKNENGRNRIEIFKESNRIGRSPLSQGEISSESELREIIESESANWGRFKMNFDITTTKREFYRKETC
jgi:uncharacterized beta-barrel protein YwiB (DUF1934 family)